MRLRVLVPTAVVVDAAVTKIVAEARNGSFCLEPRHIDFVSALATGILSYVEADGTERHVAVDAGTLVKAGSDVLVSAFDAVGGVPLEVLQAEVARRSSEVAEDERTARQALARLEADALRRFYELERRRHD